MAKESPRPLFAFGADQAAEERARRLIIAERINAVEAAMRAIGFCEESVYWRLAKLVAKVAGWETLRRSLDDIANDTELKIEASKPADRKRVVRRALDELTRWGLVRWSTETGEARRRTRPASVAVIQLDRDVITAEANGDQVVSPPVEKKQVQDSKESRIRDADIESDNEADNGSDNGADDTSDRPRTTGVTTGRTEQIASSYTLIDPKTLNPKNPSSPSATHENWLAAAADLKGFVFKSPEAVIESAIAAGMAPADLASLIRQTKAAGLNGGAVVSAIRRGDWVGLVEAEQTRQETAQAAASQRGSDEADRIRMRATKDVRTRLRRPVMTDDAVAIAEIVPALLRAGLSDEMTLAEREFFDSRRAAAAERSAAAHGKP